MKRSPSVPIHYHLMIYRREQIWLLAGLWALFAFIALVMRDDPKDLYLIGGFLGTVLPLVAGVLATSAMVGDPALELQMAAPRPAWRTLLERLALLLVLTAVAALAYQAFLAIVGVDISVFGSLAARQLLWFVPSVALMGLASAVVLGAAQGTVGGMVIAALWLAQLLLRDWFAESEWARYLFLFMGACRPESPDLPANQISLLALTAGLIVVSSLLLKNEERYL